MDWNLSRETEQMKQLVAIHDLNAASLSRSTWFHMNEETRHDLIRPPVRLESDVLPKVSTMMARQMLRRNMPTTTQKLNRYTAQPRISHHGSEIGALGSTWMIPPCRGNL